MGRDDLGSDPALADNAGRAKRAEELDAAIGGWAAKHDAPALLALLDRAQVPNGKIYSIADIAADPQYLAREMIRQFTLKDGMPLKLPGIVPKLSDTPGDIDWVGPELGAHTDEVLRAHGYAAAAIAELRRKKVI
jgi:formyl-CoA transferase